MSIEGKLNELGITLPDAPAPAANYVPYVLVDNTLYVSGQVSMDEAGQFITGKVGADLDVEAGAAAARRCAMSLLAQVRAACGGDLDRLKAQGYSGVPAPGAGQRSFRMNRHRGRGKYFFKHRGGGYQPSSGFRGKANRADTLLKQIQESGHIPCLYFTFSRRRVENLAEEFSRMDLATPEIKQKLPLQLLISSKKLFRKQKINAPRTICGI